jgi:hypothetical protein
MPRRMRSKPLLEPLAGSLSAAQPGHEVRLVGERVEHVADEELARPGAVSAEAAFEVVLGGKRLGDDHRGVASRADESAVGDQLESVAPDAPIVREVRRSGLALTGQWPVAEGVEVKSH